MDFPTPYVRIDLPTVRANLAQLHGAVASKGFAVRPHAKTHKLLAVARMQHEAGAQGLTVATVDEAEVFAAGGFSDLFIAFPVWPTENAQRRIASLIEGGAKIRVGVDSVEAAQRWDVDGLELMVELDSGHHRSGTLPHLAPDVARAARVPVVGVFTFPGHSYAPGAAHSAAESELDTLVAARDELAKAGFEGLILSGGSTPSATESAEQLDEIRPGVYPFYDVQQMELGRCEEKDIALTVVATVVSRREDLGTFILDAGSKILGSDRPEWLDGMGRIQGFPQARIVALSEHHATVKWEDEKLPELGAELAIYPNHVCLVPNLADEVIAVDGDQVEVWTVDA